LAERLAMARELMTELREVERGERIFTAALAAAADDEARAEIRFARATAIRAREDLPENSYYVELERLAADLPATRYGSIARDRAAASQFKLGGAAIPFRARTIGGETVALAELQGKAVLLAFWSLADHGAGATIAAIEQLRSQHGQDLFVLGIALESDCAAFAKALAPLGATFPQVCDGGGADAELALRYHVETTPTLIVLDRQGKIAGLNLHVDTVDAQQELAEALARALAPASPK
jgi:peroxiredoxin